MSRTDAAILVLSIMLVAVLAAWQWRPAEMATWVSVWLDGDLVEQMELATDTSVDIHGPAGTTRVTVEAGRVRVTESPGRRQLCVRDGWLQSPGDTAVCLPNRVIVEVTGEDPQFDAINQ